jgi:hypothetical protein
VKTLTHSTDPTVRIVVRVEDVAKYESCGWRTIDIPADSGAK